MRKNQHLLPAVLSGLLFLGCFRFGLLLAEHRPLWNDEIYSQVGNVSRKSYLDFFLGRAGEGNNCPLFYSLQKVICDLSGYRTPDLWHGQDIYDRLLLRLQPVFFTSLMVACLFYYFARFHSMATGVYALFLASSSLIIWQYWAEARPYTLWMFLTTAQALYFLRLCHREKIDGRSRAVLTLIHFLLCLTIVFGLAQVAIVSGLLWVLKDRDWKPYIWAALVPMGLAFYYYTQAPHYNFYFDFTPEQLIRACFSRDRFYILFMFIFFLALYYPARKTRFSGMFPGKVLLEGLTCFWLTGLMLLAAFSVLAVFKIKAVPSTQTGFPVSSRYFVYLTPIGVISTTILSTSVLRSLSGNRWVQIPVLCGIVYLVGHRFLKLYPLIKCVWAPIFE